MKRKILLSILLMVLSSQPVKAAERVQIKVTCYCPESCSGTVTASGDRVRDGVIASTKEHLNDGALIWTLDGEFLGYYECLDVGGSKAIRNGYVIDVWKPNLEESKAFMKLTEGKCLIQYVDKPKG